MILFYSVPQRLKKVEKDREIKYSSQLKPELLRPRALCSVGRELGILACNKAILLLGKKPLQVNMRSGKLPIFPCWKN